MNHRIRDTCRHVPGRICETLRQEDKEVNARPFPILMTKKVVGNKIKFTNQIE